MATGKSIPSASHKAAIQAVYVRMQREIDAARSSLWNRYLAEVGTANPGGSVGTYIDKFNESWKRSILPNTLRPDMDSDGRHKGAVHG